jgi:hypothetical protein
MSYEVCLPESAEHSSKGKDFLLPPESRAHTHTDKSVLRGLS